SVFRPPTGDRAARRRALAGCGNSARRLSGGAPRPGERIMSLPREAIRAVIRGEHGDPFAVLGPHQGSNGLITVRAFVPDGREAREPGGIRLERGASARPFRPIDPAGLFEGDVHGRWPLAYRLRVVDPHGRAYELEDPYRFPPTLTGYDLHLLAEGTHYRI